MNDWCLMKTCTSAFEISFVKSLQNTHTLELIYYYWCFYGNYFSIFKIMMKHLFGIIDAEFHILNYKDPSIFVAVGMTKKPIETTHSIWWERISFKTEEKMRQAEDDGKEIDAFKHQLLLFVLLNFQMKEERIASCMKHDDCCKMEIGLMCVMCISYV